MTALHAIAALLETTADGTLAFRAGADAVLARILAAIPPTAHVAEVRGLIGLVVVLREERASPLASAQLEAALRHDHEVVQSLQALDAGREARNREQARRLAAETPRAAPRFDVVAPVGAVKRGALGGSALELEQRRARG